MRFEAKMKLKKEPLCFSKKLLYFAVKIPLQNLSDSAQAGTAREKTRCENDVMNQTSPYKQTSFFTRKPILIPKALFKNELFFWIPSVSVLFLSEHAYILWLSQCLVICILFLLGPRVFSYSRVLLKTVYKMSSKRRKFTIERVKDKPYTALVSH